MTDSVSAPTPVQYTARDFKRAFEEYFESFMGRSRKGSIEPEKIPQ